MMTSTINLRTVTHEVSTDDRLMVVPYSIGGVGLVIDNPDNTERVVLRFETVHADTLHALWIELKRQADKAVA